jgi:hypothetical protein
MIYFVLHLGMCRISHTDNMEEVTDELARFWKKQFPFTQQR